MHEFLISRAKNRDMYHRLSPGCTILIHHHPAKKWAIAERTLAVHFHLPVIGPISALHTHTKKKLLGSGQKGF